MGEHFQSCKSLGETRDLSIQLDKASKEAFRLLVDKTIDSLVEQLTEPNSVFDLSKEDCKTYLPLRPILIAGDDITFVSEGRLGIYYAHLFVNEWIVQIKNLFERDFSCCAGVAIQKTSYPFSKGYELAESLCKNAKKRARTHRQYGESSWIDFHVAYSAFSGSIEEIRSKHYLSADSNHLCQGPYGIDLPTDSLPIHRFELFLEGLKAMQEKPRTKLKELREVFTLGPTETKKWLRQQQSFCLPQAYSSLADHESYHQDGWLKDQTSYFDMINIMDFFPEFLFKGGFL
jgi:hypothetical protein